jgi:RHS repeat-associated protein
VASRKGYAGYESDGGVGDLCHVRHRDYRLSIGTWTQRDPLIAIDGNSQYAYVRNAPILAVDSSGLWATRPGSLGDGMVWLVPTNHTFAPAGRLDWLHRAEWRMLVGFRCPIWERRWIVQFVQHVGYVSFCDDSYYVDVSKTIGYWWESMEVPPHRFEPELNGAPARDEFRWGAKDTKSPPMGVTISGVAREVCLSDINPLIPNDDPSRWPADPQHTGGWGKTTHAPTWWNWAEPMSSHELRTSWNTCSDESWQSSGPAHPSLKGQMTCTISEQMDGVVCGDN